MLAGVTLLGSACTKSAEIPASPPAKAPPPPAAAPSPAAVPAAAVPSQDPAQVLTGIPGMDFSSLPPAAKRELATVFSDEFCYCGCPHSLGACLKQHTTCKHAKRMARLSARLVSEGGPASEVIVTLSKYYASFREPRTALKVDPRMCQGNANAPVTVAEFSDFECPFCGKARPILEGFARKHPAEVRFCFLPFPLGIHPNAVPAAQAVLWARDQGKFWQMHDALFGQQENLKPEALPALAKSVGLDGDKLAAVLKTEQYKDEIEGFRAQGRTAAITGTPSVFFNGRAYDLGYQEEQLSHSMEDEVEWRANNNAWAAD